MLLDLSNFLSEELDEYSFSGNLESTDSSFEVDDLNLIFPIYYKGKITNLISGYELNLQITYKFKTHCDRCLKEIVAEIQTPYKGYYYKDKSLYDEDSVEDYFQIQEQAINLDEIIISLVIMSKPYKVLCKEDCKGLCPICGTNINENTCECSKKITEQSIDPRFAKLKDLFKNEEV